MQRNGPELKSVAQQTELIRVDEIRELEAHHIVELPDREAISVVNGSATLAIGTAASAGLLPL